MCVSTLVPRLVPSINAIYHRLFSTQVAWSVRLCVCVLARWYLASCRRSTLSIIVCSVRAVSWSTALIECSTSTVSSDSTSWSGPYRGNYSLLTTRYFLRRTITSALRSASTLYQAVMIISILLLLLLSLLVLLWLLWSLLLGCRRRRKQSRRSRGLTAVAVTRGSTLTGSVGGAKCAVYTVCWRVGWRV